MWTGIGKPAAHPPGVDAVIEPGEVRVDERSRGFAGGQCHRHRAPEVGLESRLDRSLGDSACGLHGLRVLEDPARHLGRGFQRADKGLPVLALRGLDGAGEHLGVPPDEPHGLPPDAAEPPRDAGIMNEFFEERCRQRDAERGDAASPHPGTASGDLIQKLLDVSH